MRTPQLAFLSLALLLSACGNQVKNDTGTIDTSQITVTVGGKASLNALGAGGKALDTDKLGAISNKDSQLVFFSQQLILSSDSEAEIKKLVRETGGRVLSDGKIPQAPATVPSNELRKPSQTSHYLVEFPAQKASIEEFKVALAKQGVSGNVDVDSQKTMDDYVRLQTLRASTKVSIEPNLIALSSAYLDAPEQNGFTGRYNWALNTANKATGRSGLNVEQAWQNGYTGEGMQVAIIDTGFVKEDYELSGYNPVTSSTQKWVSGYNFTAGVADPYNSITSANGDPDPNGSTWHGYSVAQSAVGASNNRYGTSGSAPGARAYLFRVGQGVGGAYSYYDASRAVDTAVAWGADVINMSFGVRTPGALGVPNSYLASALANAEAAGVINVAAAGNDSGWVGTTKWGWDQFPVPASWNSVISVGAVEENLNRTSYSAWGPGVQILGPGYSDLAPSPKDCPTYFTDRCATSSFLSRFNGTSNAAPFVAGVAALMKQAKPTITTSQVRSLLISTSTKNALNESVVNAWAAVDAARKLP